MERYRQNAFELRKKVEERRQHRYSGRGEWDDFELNGPPDVGWRLDRGYGSSWSLGNDAGDTLHEVYSQGRELEYYRQQELYLREQLTLMSYRDLFDRGLDLFREGAYGQAARAFAAAADKDRQDAASRIHAGQAFMAVGVYDQALAHVRRAFELQPLLMQLPLDLATDYADLDDYRVHLAELRAHVQTHPKDWDAAVLLAYVEFFSAEPQGATAALLRIKPLARRDPFARKLLAAAAPIVPGAR